MVGRDGPHVAYNLAGLLAEALTSSRGPVPEAGDGDGAGEAPDEPLVLFVDAEGSVTREFLAPNGIPLPDAFLAPDEAPAGFSSYAKRAAGGSRFVALARPDQTMLKMDNALSAAEAGPYSCVVVACGAAEKDYYAEDWLKSATRVVAAGAHTGPVSHFSREGAAASPNGTPAGPLAAALWAEDVRGTNGTLLAPLGPQDHLALREDLKGRTDASHRTLFPLASKEEGLLAGVTPYTFAAVSHPETAASFRPLAEALLTAAGSATGTAAGTANGPAGANHDPKGS